MASSAEPLTLIVAGGPGNGKSTFLNHFAGKTSKKSSLFAVGSGGDSCTQKVSEHCVDVEGLPVKLIDTMGFPDPDPTKAPVYYDQVVGACNKQVHAIIFLVKVERKVPGIIQQYKVLFREFNNACCKKFLVCNSFENYDGDDEDEEDLEEQKRLDNEKSRDFALAIQETCGICFDAIIISATKSDLKNVKYQLAPHLVGTVAKSSNIRNFQDICDAQSKIVSNEVAAQQEEERHIESIKQKRAMISESKERQTRLTEMKSEKVTKEKKVCESRVETGKNYAVGFIPWGDNWGDFGTTRRSVVNWKTITETVAKYTEMQIADMEREARRKEAECDEAEEYISDAQRSQQKAADRKEHFASLAKRMMQDVEEMALALTGKKAIN